MCTSVWGFITKTLIIAMITSVVFVSGVIKQIELHFMTESNSKTTK